jgi:hypothetical protein
MQHSLSSPRTATWETLKKSRNLAAARLMVQGLSSNSSELRHQCLAALLARKEAGNYHAILLKWELLDARDHELLRKESRHFSDVASKLLESGSMSEKRLAMEAIRVLDIVESVDQVLDIVVDSRHPLATHANACLQHMCEHWGQLARSGKSAPSVRSVLLDKLNRRLAVFYEHKNLLLVDAWLCLAHWEDSAQRGLISDPRQDAYRSVLKRLAASDKIPILQLLGGYLWRSSTPASVMKILCERPEPELAIEIARLLDSQTLPTALKHLRQNPTLECLKQLDMNTLSVGFDLQKTLWLMLAASLEDLPRVLEGAVRLSKTGTADARQTAAEMLRRCRRPDIATLVPAIQASSLGLEQENSLVQLMDEVVNWLSSPSVVLKRAAQDFLSDFTVANLVEQARHWPTQMCRAMANIVVKTEIGIDETLSRELQNPSPKRRLTALQITEMLGCGDKVSQWLMPLLDDPRLDVRVRVIDLLSALGHESLDTLIPELLKDASTDIQDAANRALRRKSRHASITSSDKLDSSHSQNAETG